MMILSCGRRRCHHHHRCRNRRVEHFCTLWYKSHKNGSKVFLLQKCVHNVMTFAAVPGCCWLLLLLLLLIETSFPDIFLLFFFSQKYMFWSCF